MEKYIGQLSLRYSTHKCLDSALSNGMKEVSGITKLPATTFYWARHTFANTARNDCRMSKDDIGLALNHIDGGQGLEVLVFPKN